MKTVPYVPLSHPFVERLVGIGHSTDKRRSAYRVRRNRSNDFAGFVGPASARSGICITVTAGDATRSRSTFLPTPSTFLKDGLSASAL